MRIYFLDKDNERRDINSLDLTTNQYAYFGELLQSSTELFKSMDKKQLISNIKKHKELTLAKTKLFRQHISYKNKFKLQQNRIQFKTYFSKLTKQMEEEYFNELILKKEQFQFVKFSFNDNQEEFEFKCYKVTFKDSQLKLYDKLTNENTLRVLMKDDCIYIDEKYINGFTELKFLFGEDFSEFETEKDITINKDKFKDIFNKVYVKEKMELF